MESASVIYVTGAPATGKSTLTRSIAQSRPDVRLFTYSKELRNRVRERDAATSEMDLRTKSAAIITREDVRATDEELITLVRELRGTMPVVIDSHPVTIEQYGFRVTPFSKEMLRRLSPTIVVCLFADAETLRDRISRDPQGRPLPSSEDLTRHVNLQAMVATNYAFETGASLYFLDANLGASIVESNFLTVTKLGNSVKPTA